MVNTLIRFAGIRKIDNGYILDWNEEVQKDEDAVAQNGVSCPAPCVRKELYCASLEDCLKKLTDLSM